MSIDFYSDYDRLIRATCPDYDHCLKLLAKSIPDDTKTVLDLGSGTGNLILSILNHHPNSRIYGIELQPNLISIANRKIVGSNVRLIQGDILKCNWPKVDCVTSSLTIHNLTHEKKAGLLRKVFKNSNSFLYFDRFKGKNKTEEEENLNYVFKYMRSSGLSEKMVKKAQQEMTRKDMPLTIKEQNHLFSKIGFDYNMIYLRHGFAIYFCTKKE